MITEVKAGPFTIRGVSIGGVYTTLHVPELGSLFDVGLAPRSVAGVRQLFLSHGHVDHSGALATLLGLRALVGKTQPLRVYLPAEIASHLTEALEAMSRMQRYDLSILPVPMSPGDEIPVRADLRVRAFRTHHPVPSLGYQFFRRVKKLRRGFSGLSGREIAARRRAGEELFDEEDHLEFAYATDTLVRVLDTTPSLLETRVLVLECTFLDDRKSLAATHAGCHIHLDEILERAEQFANQQLVLMHFSQMYSPGEVADILRRRLPEPLRRRVVPFVPARDWPG